MNDLEKEFVSYEQALSLKELGFDEECFSWWGSAGILKQNYDLCNTVKAPLYQQAFRFFRDKHNLDSWIYCHDESKGYFAIILKHKRFVSYHENFDTYEEAELACLNKLIEIAKNGNKS